MCLKCSVWSRGAVGRVLDRAGVGGDVGGMVWGEEETALWL